MKLLFDQNLSPRLVRRLSDVFPASAHVRALGLARGVDEIVWQHAAVRELTIVSKDSDFHHISCLRGHPPKVVWIRKRNCSSAEVESILRRHAADVRAFAAAPGPSFLVLS